MNHMQKQDRLEWIAHLIKQEKTGTPQEFAQKCNNMGEKTLRRQICILRQYAGRANAQILYDNKEQTYYFDPPGKFTDFKFKEDQTN